MTEPLPTAPANPTTDPVRARIDAWIEEAVIGLRLCPFATAPWRAGQVRVHVSAATNADDAARDALEEAFALIEADEEKIATTLVVVPGGLDDFEEFLDAVASVDHILDKAGGRGLLQVASFHPRFRFEGVDEADLGNWTNRAPYPIFHLLREAHVTAAIDQHPDTEKIPDDNVARLEAMGRAAVLALWGRFAAP
ncbi:MAG: DUF1415 domain-containing protein [Myxococcota bacterium]